MTQLYFSLMWDLSLLDVPSHVARLWLMSGPSCVDILRVGMMEIVQVV